MEEQVDQRDYPPYKATKTNIFPVAAEPVSSLLMLRCPAFPLQLPKPLSNLYLSPPSGHTGFIFILARDS